MRKVIVWIMIMSLLFGLCSCTTKHLSIEQSKKNFLAYQNELQKIANQYGLELTETTDSNIENQDSCKDLCIICGDAKIKIRMINSAYNSKNGVESFDVNYTLNNQNSENLFNLGLFVDIVNRISGKTISADFCKEFLDAPESKYAGEKYGYKKLNDEIIAKQYPLNFSEDWTIGYILSKQKEETLYFGGLTKQLTQ